MDKEDLENRSFIVIEFEGFGSANILSMNIHNVTPLQVLAIASYLELNAKNELLIQRNKVVEQQEASKLIIPGK